MTTTPTKQVHREFWIDSEILIKSQNMLVTFVYKNEQSDCVKVIEYSAVQELEAEIKRLNDKYDFQLLVKRNEELEKELADKEKAIIMNFKRYVEASLKIQNLEKELKQVRDKVLSEYEGE